MFYIGLDLGQKRDHSAVVVVERIDHRPAFQGTEFALLVARYAQRLPLGTPYPRVVERMREITRNPAVRGECALVVDATGVGAPVVDMLRAARLGCEVTAVTITGGDRGTTESAPKRDLLAGVQVLLEHGLLKLGKLREGARLRQELADMRMAMTGAGRMRVGAEGAGEHDDLAIALALACWRARRKGIFDGSRRLV